MATNRTPDVQIVMPVHNEAGCIRAVITEIYDELSTRLQPEFIVCEDGSRDGTKQILEELKSTMPMQLLTGDQRKGYTRAMIDGLRRCTADFILCLDSDGQYWPSDFWDFYRHREDYDITIGWRRPRMDHLHRRVMSRCFRAIHSALFHLPVHDPSCGFILMKREVIESVLDDLGTLDQGFQWEFMARAHMKGARIREIPVRHRARRNGATQVYHIHRLPAIFSSHVWGLLMIWRETRGRRGHSVSYSVNHS